MALLSVEDEVTRAEILSLARSAGGLLDAPKAWALETMAAVQDLEADGLIRLELAEFNYENRIIRVKAWFVVEPEQRESTFTDEEATG